MGSKIARRGFKSFIVPSAIMEHSIGDASSLRPWPHRLNFHNLTRNYFIVRNATYLLRPRDMGWRWVTVMIPRIPKHIAVHSWYSRQKLRSLIVLVGAVLAGARGSLGPVSEK